MDFERVSYWSATRHPRVTLVFLLPLLLCYEGGVLWLGGAEADTLRNGADLWVQKTFKEVGLPQAYLAPGLIILLLILQCWFSRKDKPEDISGVCLGMAIESVVFALGLWGISRSLPTFIDSLGIRLEVIPLDPKDKILAQLVRYVGAGIFEELVFRLLLLTALAWAFRRIEIPTFLAVLLASLISAAVFSGVHHFGIGSEAFDAYRFLFRLLAGLYFAILYQTRGFGVAVGAHACYDVMVGMMVV